MSKVAIQGNASGSGVLTIAAPNTDTDRTLTLPDAAGLVLIGDAVTGRLPDANAPSGSVIQVVQAVSSTTTNSTSTTYADASGLSASITPQSTSSKILVLVDVVVRGQASDNQVAGIQIVRDATAIHTDDYAFNIGVNANVGVAAHTCMNYLDSPNTTSATTYKVQIRRVSSAGISYAFQVNPTTNSRSTITLMEIAA